jgi:hypothetical protein
MDVDVRDGLARRSAIVQPDVETVRMMLLQQASTHPLNEVPQSQLVSNKVATCWRGITSVWPGETGYLPFFRTVAQVLTPETSCSPVVVHLPRQILPNTSPARGKGGTLRAGGRELAPKAHTHISSQFSTPRE